MIEDIAVGPKTEEQYGRQIQKRIKRSTANEKEAPCNYQCDG